MVVARPKLGYRPDVPRPRILGLLIALLSPAAAQADVTHVVARGHTLDAIAHRYHVTVKAILDANHLKDPRHLRVGQFLVIPGVNPPAPRLPAGAHGTAAPGHAAVSYAARPRTPGVIHIKRLATAEEVNLRVGDRRGRVPPTALRTAEHLWRYPNGLTHEIDSRLLSLLGIVSDHFGSRRIEIVSGFRPYSPTQYTPHSNHNVGHAVDFRVEGVPNEAVRDFCRTLHNVGVGYYPNSVFVHLDSRPSPAYWVDYSRPGEPPRYDSPNSGADEGASEVTDEVHASAPSEPRPTAATSTQNSWGWAVGSNVTPAAEGATANP